MHIFDSDLSSLPLEYWLCAFLIAAGIAFALRQSHLIWVPPFVAVMGTVAAWYMVEPLYYDDFFLDFSSTDIAAAYRCLFVFLVTFVIGTPIAVRNFDPKAHLQARTEFSIGPEQIVTRVVFLWLVLLAYGIFRMEGDVLGALFPIHGRAEGSMWSRSAAEGAGPTGFIVSTATYLYILVLSAFGLLLPITRKGTARVLLILCIVISWPYAFLQGSRNVTLAVITPGLIAYLLLGRQHPFAKTAFGVGAFIAVDLAMRAIIGFRDVGFGSVTIREIEEAKHLGLNMASELTYIVSFVERGIIELSYGWDYLVELLNVVPRAMWPNKPSIGIDYAIARGFGGGESDTGVFATVSTGMVGQAVLNFGIWLGPIFAGALMAMWVGLLTRLRRQGGAARLGLFLVGLGLTFNMGRNVTLLVLFPFVFGYGGVLLLEARDRRKAERARLEARGLEMRTRAFAARATTAD